MDYTTKGIKIIKEKNLFDENYYIKNYGEEIGNQDPLNHFIFTGFKEGKNPSSNFDTVYYIQKYPDTKDFNPLIHYALWGKEEFRFTNLNMEMDYISLGINEIINQNLFDEDFYIKNYGK